MSLLVYEIFLASLSVELYCATATLSGIWPANVAWAWKHGPQLPIYIKVTTPRTHQTKEGQKKNHKKSAVFISTSYQADHCFGICTVE